MHRSKGIGLTCRSVNALQEKEVQDYSHAKGAPTAVMFHNLSCKPHSCHGCYDGYDNGCYHWILRRLLHWLLQRVLLTLCIPASNIAFKPFRGMQHLNIYYLQCAKI